MGYCTVQCEGSKPTKHVIAFIEMLGASASILNDDEYQYNNLFTLYNFITSFNNEPIFGDKAVKVKIFSDNIVIAKEIKDEQKTLEIISSIVQVIADFQARGLYHCKWLMRGGITIGDISINDTMVWGKGLIKAYFLESNIATYPRIIFDEVITDYTGTNSENLQSCFVRRDFDGQLFLDYLETVNLTPIRDEPILQILKIRYQNLSKKEQLKAKVKLDWHINYLNSKIEEQKHNWKEGRFNF